MRAIRPGGMVRAGRMVAVTAAVMLAAAGFAWCVAVLVHLYFLRRWLTGARC
jgi:hypothetical protein